MKNKGRPFFLMLCSLAMAAVVYAELKKGDYSPAELGILRQAAPVGLTPDSNFQVSAYPVPAIDLAPGEAEVNKMNKTFGAAIPEDSTQKIILYLQAHYTPDTRKE